MQSDNTPSSPNGGPPARPPLSDGNRPVLVAYPLRYARQDDGGRLVLDPARLPQPAPAVAPAQAAPSRELTLLLLVGVGVLLLDQLTKRLIEAQMPLYSDAVPFAWLFPYFRFTHTANYGAAFGLFQSGGLLFGIVAALVAVVILYYNFVLPPGQRLLRTALGLQLGGALGNLIDRLRLGYVTDFMDVDVSSIVDIPYISDWPIFNVADMAIVSGVILLAFLMITEGEQLGGSPPPAGSRQKTPGIERPTAADDGQQPLPGVTIHDGPPRATTLSSPPVASDVPAEEAPPWDVDGH